MTTLSGFESNLQDSLTDDMEAGLYAEPDNLAYQLLRAANQNFEEYASRQGYDIGGIPQSGKVTSTSRSRGSVSATIEWTHGLTALYEYGVSPFTMHGSPILSFYWDSPPEGTRPEGAPAFVNTTEVNWGSVTGGIPEARAIRGALNYIRLQGEGSTTL